MRPTGGVEVWLSEVEQRMKSSVRGQVRWDGIACVLAPHEGMHAKRKPGFTQHKPAPRAWAESGSGLPLLSTRARPSSQLR